MKPRGRGGPGRGTAKPGKRQPPRRSRGATEAKGPWKPDEGGAKPGRPARGGRRPATAPSPRGEAAPGRFHPAPWDRNPAGKPARPKPGARPSRPEPQTRVIRHEPAARIPRASSDSLIYGMRSVRTLVEVDPGRVVRLVVDGGRDKEEPLAEVVALAEEAGVRVQRVGRDEMALMARNAVHQGLLAEVAPFRYAEVEDLVPGEGATGVEQPLLLVLDGVTDPQNLGAAARAAWALGACGLILPKDRAAPVTAAAEKVASGALAFLKVASVTNLTRTLTDLKRDGVWVVGLDVDGEAMLHDQDLTVPVALVIGSEDEGMRRLTRETCDVLCRIPMAHDEAVLNAADAAAVALYEARRQRATVDTDVVDDLDLDGEE